MRHIFVGDIQGCRPELEELLSAVAFTAADRLYCVGDIVNRGPDSLGALRLIRKLDARIVLGNHDLHLLRRAHDIEGKATRDTLGDILAAPDRDDLLGWLARQPLLRLEPDLVLVHAGLHPAWTDLNRTAASLRTALSQYLAGQANPDIDFATRARYCDAKGRRPARDDPPPGKPYRPWYKFLRADRMVVFGHWARRGLVVQPNLRGLDTGCVWGGQLTAWVREEDQIVQVRARKRWG